MSNVDSSNITSNSLPSPKGGLAEILKDSALLVAMGTVFLYFLGIREYHKYSELAGIRMDEFLPAHESVLYEGFRVLTEAFGEDPSRKWLGLPMIVVLCLCCRKTIAWIDASLKDRFRLQFAYRIFLPTLLVSVICFGLKFFVCKADEQGERHWKTCSGNAFKAEVTFKDQSKPDLVGFIVATSENSYALRTKDDDTLWVVLKDGIKYVRINQPPRNELGL